MSNWRGDAACLGVDTNIFYPTEGNPSTYAEPLSYCVRCPVIEECRAEVDRLEAIGNQVHGIWAGETETQRRQRRRKAKRKAA